MKLKLSQLVETFPAIQAFSSQKLPAKLAFKISKFLGFYTENLQTYDKVRIDKAQELGTLTKDKQGYHFQEPNASLFAKEIEALNSTEVETTLEPMPFSEIENIEIEPKHLFALQGILWKE